ncbi:MAG: PIG-L deacetylase family protein [bacterium]
MKFQQFLFDFLISKIYRAFLAMNTEFNALELSQDARCLCLAPHPDDESIGMGGTLIKKGELFDVICITNGTGGVAQELLEIEKINIRKNEFEQAMQRLKLNSYSFFDHIEDRKLVLHSKDFKKIDISQYDYIFIPNIIDQHRDHKAVSILLKELLKSEKHKKTLKIAFYEVWQTLALPNLYVDISDVIEEKKVLIEIYKSQLASKNYTRKTVGLNNFRGLLPNVDYAEAFSVIDVSTFKKICKIYTL